MNNITRYDRNLASNLDDLAFFKTDEKLIKNLIAFFSLDVGNNLLPENLFGMRRFDPAHFAEIMNYKSYRSLINKMPIENVAQFKGLSENEIFELKQKAKESGEPLWDGYLCNAFYRLRYESLKFTKPGKTPDGVHVSELHELRFLEKAIKYHDPRTNKIYYDIKYDIVFVNNLARYFLKINPLLYVSLSKPNLQDLYMFLTNEREKLNRRNTFEDIQTDHIQFETLCEKAEINIVRPSDRKNKLIKAFKLINKKANCELFKLDWKATKGMKWKYHPIITFKYAEEEIVYAHKEPVERLICFLRINLKNRFREITTGKIQTDSEFDTWFRSWVLQDDKYVSDKAQIYIKSYQQVYARTPNLIGEENNQIMFGHIHKVVA